MQKYITIGTALLATANAFLLVPHLTHPSSSSSSSSSIEHSKNPYISATSKQSLNVPCPSCPLEVPVPHSSEDEFIISTDVPNHLELHFTVNQHERLGYDRLLLNGFEVFPDVEWAGDLRAVQVADSPNVFGVPEKRRKLGYNLAIRPIPLADGHLSEFMEVKFHVIEIGSVFINSVPTVVAKVSKGPAGEMKIVSVKVLEPHSINKALTAGEACATAFCRWKALVSEHLQSVKHKMGHPCPHHSGSMSGHQYEGLKSHRSRGWSEIFQAFKYQVLLPIVIGLAVGAVVTVIGMMICSISVFVWRVLVRRQPSTFGQTLCPFSKSNEPIRNYYEQFSDSNEKERLMEQSELPANEVPPPYRDIVDEEAAI